MDKKIIIDILDKYIEKRENEARNNKIYLKSNSELNDNFIEDLERIKKLVEKIFKGEKHE